MLQSEYDFKMRTHILAEQRHGLMKTYNYSFIWAGEDLLFIYMLFNITTIIFHMKLETQTEKSSFVRNIQLSDFHTL